MLLDTNILLWILMDEERKISNAAARALAKPGVSLLVSVVSIREILIKRHAGKILGSVDAVFPVRHRRGVVISAVSPSGQSCL